MANLLDVKHSNQNHPACEAGLGPTPAVSSPLNCSFQANPFGQHLGDDQAKDSANRAIMDDGNCPNSVISFPLNRGYHALVDLEDYERLLAYRWYIKTKSDGRVYAQANIELGGRKTTFMMHRFLVNAQPSEKVDHRDGEGLHNWKENLRTFGQSENNQNSKGRKSRVTANLIGMFGTEQDAARAYDEAAVRLFGQFAQVNFPESRVSV